MLLGFASLLLKAVLVLKLESIQGKVGEVEIVDGLCQYLSHRVHDLLQ